jgi:hypothetical protein
MWSGRTETATVNGSVVLVVVVVDGGEVAGVVVRVTAVRGGPEVVLADLLAPQAAVSTAIEPMAARQHLRMAKGYSDHVGPPRVEGPECSTPWMPHPRLRRCEAGRSE